MWTDKIIVLKFGSSILHCDGAASDAVAEIYRHLRRGWRVVAIVSAIGETTDELLDRISRWDDVPGEAITTMLATGELASASILTAALRRDGIESRLLTPHQIELRTRGTAAEADPVSIRAQVIRAALRCVPVTIIPGFIGIGEDGSYTLLGRGGSDLSAVFIARAIAADRCVLLKDVDGLFERDPNVPRAPLPRRYDTITWTDAAKLDRQIMQPRAVQFGAEHEFAFEVAGLNSPRPTRVGHATTSLAAIACPARPLRIALLGLGTVGRGVLEHVRSRPLLFTIAGIAVRDVERHVEDGVAREMLTDDWRELVRRDVDVIVELIGGTGDAQLAVREALRRGRHVVTANKTLIEQRGPSLKRLARLRGSSLRFSAAVGGVTPMLEAARSVSRCHGIARLEGVINGTCNFILDRLRQGAPLIDAIAEAQRRGLAEADPADDLDGSDAARKLCLLVRAAGAKVLHCRDVSRHDLRRQWACIQRRATTEVGPVRQVASVTLRDGQGEARVSISPLPAGDELARVSGEWNAIRITARSGNSIVIQGKGAGRWPTARAVLADLLDIARRRARLALNDSRARGDGQRTIEPTDLALASFT